MYKTLFSLRTNICVFLVVASKFGPIGVRGLICVNFGVLDVKQIENHCSKGIMVSQIWSKIANKIN